MKNKTKNQKTGKKRNRVNQSINKKRTTQKHTHTSTEKNQVVKHEQRLWVSTLLITYFLDAFRSFYMITWLS